jgi:hypothetical protein
MEVQGGAKPRQTRKFISRVRKRYQRASEYAQDRRVSLVFIVLGKDWALETLRYRLSPRLPSDATLLQNWLDFGNLPKIGWGLVQTHR